MQALAYACISITAIFTENTLKDLIEMKKPKFLDLDTEERVKYTIKLNEILLDKYRELANLTDKSINETIETVLEDYIRPKVMYNTYLDNFSSYYITIPYNLLVKDYITKTSFDNVHNLKKLYKEADFKNIINMVKYRYSEIADSVEEAELYGIDVDDIIKDDDYYKYINPSLDTFKMYKVFRVPNNLDKWNNNSKTYSSYYKFDDDTVNTGLEFVIIPGIAKYTNDYTNCLYCFYFELHGNMDLIMISIEYMEALDLIEEAGNEYLLGLINTIYAALEEAEDIDDVSNLAEVYNTGNIRSNSRIKTEKVEPTKLLTGKNKKVTVSYHDKQLLKKIELLEKENKQLKEDLDTLETRTLEKIEDKITDLIG